jgi:hypothetical protein
LTTVDVETVLRDISLAFPPADATDLAKLSTPIREERRSSQVTRAFTTFGRGIREESAGFI